MGTRIYVCHTYYHVYVACLKELAAGENTPATLVLSTLSNDFSSLPARAATCPLFSDVVMFDEKDVFAFPELLPLKENTGRLFQNLKNRMKLQRSLADALEPFVPVDFRTYDDIYVFCDSDPVGYYLNARHIPYHAVEDGLDCLKYFDTARYDNRGHFRIKALFARLGLIFIQNGYAKYCIDMEVNDLAAVPWPHAKMIEVKRSALKARLSGKEKDLLIDLFLENAAEVTSLLQSQKDRPHVLLLTEPLCDLTTRKEIFQTIYKDHCCPNEALVLVKRHPRDVLDYAEVFREEIARGDVLLLPHAFPMEVLDFLPGTAFQRVVSVYTVVDAIDHVKEKCYLGDDFMDRYEEPARHRQNEQIL